MAVPEPAWPPPLTVIVRPDTSGEQSTCVTPEPPLPPVTVADTCPRKVEGREPKSSVPRLTLLPAPVTPLTIRQPVLRVMVETSSPVSVAAGLPPAASRPRAAAAIAPCRLRREERCAPDAVRMAFIAVSCGEHITPERLSPGI